MPSCSSHGILLFVSIKLLVLVPDCHAQLLFTSDITFHLQHTFYSKEFVVFFFFGSFFKSGFLCVVLGTPYVEKAVLEFTEFHLPLPRDCWVPPHLAYNKTFCLFLVLFFETGFLCVTALAVLEHTL